MASGIQTLTSTSEQKRVENTFERDRAINRWGYSGTKMLVTVGQHILHRLKQATCLSPSTKCAEQCVKPLPADICSPYFRLQVPEGTIERRTRGAQGACLTGM
jgi:hypothetical protein